MLTASPTARAIPHESFGAREMRYRATLQLAESVAFTDRSGNTASKRCHRFATPSLTAVQIGCKCMTSCRQLPHAFSARSVPWSTNAAPSQSARARRGHQTHAYKNLPARGTCAAEGVRHFAPSRELSAAHPGAQGQYSDPDSGRRAGTAGKL